jgi:hypothetical protein
MTFIISLKTDQNHSVNHRKINKLITVFALPGKLSKYLLFLGIVLYLSTAPLQSQILKDSSSIKLIKKGIDYVYNFQFKNADEVNQELKKIISHPSYKLSVQRNDYLLGKLSSDYHFRSKGKF